jgi:hypothetical protein
MNLEQYLPESFTDDKWIRYYEKIMGDKLYDYRNNVARQLFAMKTDQAFKITEWVDPRNFDLFMKVAACFVQESKGCYVFRENFTVIKKIMDQNDIQRSLKLLEENRRNKASSGDSPGAGSTGERTQGVYPPNANI